MMICPRCGKNAKALEVRTNKDGSVRQRYECQRLHKFTLVDGILLTDEAKLVKKRESAGKASAGSKLKRLTGETSEPQM